MNADSENPSSIRREEDAVELKEWQLRRADMLLQHLVEIRQLAEESWDLTTAAKQLKRLLPYPGFAASVRLIRVRAMTLEALAWCQVHQRQTQAAFRNAEEAFQLFVHIHRQTGVWSDSVHVGETSLIAAQACVAAGDVDGARRWHQIHQDHHRSSGERLNVEFFRQRGTAAVLDGRSDFAALQFEQAGRAVEGAEEAWWKAHASQRPLAVITGDWELAAEALDAIQAGRPGGLEEASAITWGRGAALSTDSDDGQSWSGRMADDSTDLLARFPRYQHLVRLMNLAERFGWFERTSEALALRRRWVSWLLYQSTSA